MEHRPSPRIMGAELCSRSELESILADIRVAAADLTLLFATPRMTLVTARKPGRP
jgi:hypothetical protein